MIRGLRVISRTSAMHFKDTRVPLPEIAKVLGVDARVPRPSLSLLKTYNIRVPRSARGSRGGVSECLQRRLDSGAGRPILFLVSI
jgi:hypothetical protein